MMECSASFFGLIDLYTDFVFSFIFLLLYFSSLECRKCQMYVIFRDFTASLPFCLWSQQLHIQLWLLHHFGHFTVSNYIRISLSLSSLLFFRLAWIAWYSQTLVWLVRPHPLFPFFSCLSCDLLCCGFVRCGSFMCCETYSNKYLTRRYFMSNVMPGWIYS